MKRQFAASWFVLVLCVVHLEAVAANAPAPNLTYYYAGTADIVVNSVKVPSAPTINTYYEALGWNFNQEGAGYTGLQFTNERVATGTYTFIFSMWDGLVPKVPVSVDYLDPGATTRPFVEGTSGTASINWSLGWLPDRWYTLVVRRWDCKGSKTCFALWVNKQAEGKWIHHITMVHPVANVGFNGYALAFLEDFRGNGKYRSVRYRNAWARTPAGWQPLGEALLGASEDAAAVVHEYRGFVDGDAFGLEAGAGVVNDIAKGHDFTVGMGASPGLPPASVAHCAASVAPDGASVQISWTPDEAKSPQFAYTVRLVRLPDGNLVEQVSATVPQARAASVPIRAAGKYRVELQLTDIFDQVSAVCAQSI
jgi:hypothetical protein